MICEYNRFIILGLSLFFGGLFIAKLLCSLPETDKFGFKRVYVEKRRLYSRISYPVMVPPIWFNILFGTFITVAFCGLIVFLTGSSNKADLNYDCQPSPMVHFIKNLF